MEEFTLAPQPALPYSAYCLSLPLISVCTGCGSVSAANLQLPQHVMDKFRNLALIECIPVYRLLANGPIRQPLARLLHEVENHGTFAKTNIFIADFRRSPAPRFPASKRAAPIIGDLPMLFIQDFIRTSSKRTPSLRDKTLNSLESCGCQRNAPRRTRQVRGQFLPLPWADCQARGAAQSEGGKTTGQNFGFG